MTLKKIPLFLIFISVLMLSCKNNSDTKNESLSEETTPQRIISLNGSITETVSALGLEKQLVGVDVTSSYPATVKENAKNLGHISSVTIEPLMELKPDVILATAHDLNPDLQKQIMASGITLHVFQLDYSLNGSKRFIKEVAEKLQVEGFASIHQKIDADLEQTTDFDHAPNVLFIYARGAGSLMVAGNKTPMQQVVEMAGGRYDMTDFEAFKPLTPEALVQSNPDVLLFFDSGLQSLGGMHGLMQLPGIAQTNAGKNQAVIVIDGALISGFGPRLGEAVATLNHALKEYAN